MVGVTKALAAEIEVLTSNTEQAKLRLQLLVQWWEEFHNNLTEVTSWLEEAETNLGQLLARYQSAQPPRVSPLDLRQEIKASSAFQTIVIPLAFPELSLDQFLGKPLTFCIEGNF